MTRVFSIFERIGRSGGGKVKSVYHRMNALAEIDGFAPILLSIDHDPQHKLNFAQLQGEGKIAPGVVTLSVPEGCHAAAQAAGIAAFDGFPAFDQVRRQGNRRIYSRQGQEVMTDKVRTTAIGELVRRSVPGKAEVLDYDLIDGVPFRLVQENADGTTETTDYAHGLPVRWTKAKGRSFVVGRNLINGKIYRMPRAFGCSFFELIDWDGAVVFFDGVTSAYLSAVTKAPRALFLHADHRGPAGDIVARSRFLIENFKGEAIITSTAVHKAQIAADVTPAAPVHVIPHFCKASQEVAQQRRDLVTVSRLELTGKPIHECIAAFCQIKDEFPGVDYLIYGTGSGRGRLAAQIKALDCGGRVRLMGYTTQPLAVFAAALAAVYPTTTEGFGLSILEALSHGCPVISYDVNYGPREMIVPGVQGELVPPGDIDAIAEAMRRVLQHPEAYQRRTGQELDRYGRQAYLRNYRDIVTRLAAARGAG